MNQQSCPPPSEGLGEVKFKDEKPSVDLGEVRKVGKVYINETQYFDNVPEVA